MFEKLKILADSAKYDASCSTSGVERKNSGRIGNASGAGICHSWSADGRCISLLKVLMTNKCVYDCEYCINRRTAEVARASFEPEELADLTMEFYRRNYIEGLFLSSAVEVSPDATAERMHRVMWLLREEYGFAGYIHAKIIPGADKGLVHKIGLVADRVSVNIELPSKESLGLLAPQKKPKGIFQPMKQITETISDRKQLKSGGDALWKGGGPQYLNPSDSVSDKGFMTLQETGRKYKEVFAPAGQTTQMIIGASPESDRQIVKMSESLYQSFRMKRVYFSAYIPIHETPNLPALLTAPPLVREHRLYQADWLLRFYGFSADEILDTENPNLDPDLDPKIMWALRNINQFPIEINKASYEELMRIPGVGNISARRIIRQRRYAAVKFDDLKKIGVVVKRAKYFIVCCGRYFGEIDPEAERIRGILTSEDPLVKKRGLMSGEQQLSMFDGPRLLEESRSSSILSIPQAPVLHPGTAMVKEVVK